MCKTIVVTRHLSLIKYLQENNMIKKEKVYKHASAKIVKGNHVIGVLPHKLSCLAKTYTEIPLALPAEIRGRELTIEEIRKYAKEPITYVVQKHTL